MSRRWIILRCVSEISFTLLVTHSAMKWASHMAYIERGHAAVGGEVLFAGLAAYIAYKAIDTLFRALEDEIYAELRKRHKERRGRRSTEMQHNR